MKQVKYGEDAQPLRCEFPPAWDSEAITGVEISIADRSGTELLAATAATLYTATTLNADVDAGAEYFVLAEGASAVEPGDIVLIGDSDDGEPETIVVNHYDAVNRRVYGEEDLKDAHSSGAAVIGLFATYSLDISDTDTYTKGKQLVVTWNPNTDDIAYTEVYQVSGTQMASSAFWRDFGALYPVEYEIASKRDTVAFEGLIRRLFSQELMNHSMDSNRIVDQDRLLGGMVLYARWTILRDPEERQAARKDFENWVTMLAQDPIWIDHDQDGVEEDAEKSTHTWEITEQNI
jgi:hypothetical protein